MAVVKRLLKKLGNVGRGYTSIALLFSLDVKSFTIFMENSKTHVSESTFSIVVTQKVDFFFMS